MSKILEKVILLSQGLSIDILPICTDSIGIIEQSFTEKLQKKNIISSN